MKNMKREKHVWEQLNRRQEDAVKRAEQGDFFSIVQCCLECHKAEDKAIKAIDLGVTQWGSKTIEHYRKIRCYLETFISDDNTWMAYQQMVERREDNGK